MNRKETLEELNRLRVEGDPRFASELSAIADSLQALLEGASKGGKQRAKILSQKRRKEIASNAAKARWNRPRKGETK